MNGYLVGAGAVIEVGPPARIVPASLHAQTDPRLAERVGAALFDFEGSDPLGLSRVAVVAVGWDSQRFRRGFLQSLVARRSASLGEVLVDLAVATGNRDVHVFARWLPPVQACMMAERVGLRIVAHPLEVVGQVALVSAEGIARPVSLRLAS